MAAKTPPPFLGRPYASTKSIRINIGSIKKGGFSATHHFFSFAVTLKPYCIANPYKHSQLRKKNP
jgi:hypothetical protein